MQALSTLLVEDRLAATLLRLARHVDLEEPESVSRAFVCRRERGLRGTGAAGPLLRDVPALRALSEAPA